MTNSVIVYCLKEPDTGEIRYFGKTCKKMKRRFSEHLSGKKKYRVVSWIKKLRAENKIPVYEVVATGCDNFTACEIEKALIKMGRETGMRLTNLTDGGEGILGLVRSAETRKKISSAVKGNKNCLGKKNFLGKKHSPEAKAKISKALLGNKYCSGYKHRLGIKHSQETKAKISASGVGRKHPKSPEYRLRISLGMKKWWKEKVVGNKSTVVKFER